MPKLYVLLLSFMLNAGFTFSQAGFFELPLFPSGKEPDVFLATEKPAAAFIKMQVMEEFGNSLATYHELLDSMKQRARAMGVDALWVQGTQPRVVANANGIGGVVVLQAVALKYASNLAYISNYPYRLRIQRSDGDADTISLRWNFQLGPSSTRLGKWLIQDVMPWIPPLVLPAMQPGYTYKWNEVKSRLRLKDNNPAAQRQFDYEMQGNVLEKIEYTELLPEKKIKQNLELRSKADRLIETRLRQGDKTIWHHYYNYDQQGRLASIEQWMMDGSSRSKAFELFIDYRTVEAIPRSFIVQPDQLLMAGTTN